MISLYRHNEWISTKLPVSILIEYRNQSFDKLHVCRTDSRLIYFDEIENSAFLFFINRTLIDTKSHFTGVLYFHMRRYRFQYIGI